MFEPAPNKSFTMAIKPVDMKSFEVSLSIITLLSIERSEFRGRKRCMGISKIGRPKKNSVTGQG